MYCNDIFSVHTAIKHFSKNEIQIKLIQQYNISKYSIIYQIFFLLFYEYRNMRGKNKEILVFNLIQPENNKHSNHRLV